MDQRLITVAVVTAQAVLTFLLTQPDVVLAPPWKLALGAAAVGLTAIARYLPSEGSAVRVEVSQPVPVTPVEPDA